MLGKLLKRFGLYTAGPLNPIYGSESLEAIEYNSWNEVPGILDIPK